MSEICDARWRLREGAENFSWELTLRSSTVKRGFDRPDGPIRAPKNNIYIYINKSEECSQLVGPGGGARCALTVMGCEDD